MSCTKKGMTLRRYATLEAVVGRSGTDSIGKVGVFLALGRPGGNTSRALQYGFLGIGWVIEDVTKSEALLS